MGLSSDILKDFAGLVNEDRTEDDSKKYTTAYGTAVVSDGVKYVQIDGSDYLTPISEATDAEDGDRVLVEVKSHRATVIGNFTAPPSLRDSQAANEKADDASQKAQNAEDAANEAIDSANNASQKADEALTKAEESKQASENAQQLIGEANVKIEALGDEIEAVRKDTDDIRTEVKEELPKLIDETLTAEYAKKTDLVDVKGELEAKISASAGELETDFSEHYVTQSELVKLEEQLNTKINQNSEEIALAASRTTKMETDTEDIKEDLLAAQNAVRQASQLASEAKDLANAAERELLKAQDKLTIAQTELEEAEAYYTAVSSKDDATEEEIAEAQTAVAEAELAVSRATVDVEAAQTAADEAIADAQAAAQALEEAKQRLSEVASRIEELEASIKVNADAIDINAKKISEVDDNLNNNYYTKTEAEAKFTVDADSITSTVTQTVMVQVKQEGYVTEDDVDAKIDDIEIGSRNMCTGTSSEWTEFDLGAEYIVIMRFKMEDLCTNFDLNNGDKLTYSIYLRSNSGKTIAASWQKYNDDIDRSGEVSEDIVVNDIGRSIVHPIVDTSYEYLDLMVTNVSSTITTDTVEYYRCLQLETGDIATEWNPAPEDMDERVDGVEGNLNETDKKLEDIDTKVVNNISQIEQLADMISTLVTGENGESLMQQTDTGWTFNISGIQENVANNGDAISKLQELINTLSATTGGLEDAVGNLQETSEYIWLTTYEDEPCIALGESDSSYGLFITNTRIIFIDGSGNPTYISKDGLYTNKLTVGTEFRQQNFIWSVRQNGNYGLMWKQIKVVSIAAFHNGTAYTGTSFDALTDLVVKVTYSDGTTGYTNDYTVNSGTIVEGSNTITITVGELTTTCTVTGEVYVAKDIVITKQPGNMTVQAGEDFTVSVTATGEEPLSYQWKYSWNNSTWYSASSAGDSPTWTHSISDTSTSEVQYIRCVITDANGNSVSSDIATITIMRKTLSSISATYTGGSVSVGTSVNSLTGITVKATYSDGSTETVTGYTLSGSISNAGNNTITISYGGKSTTITVTGYTTGSGELVMKTGTVSGTSTIDTGLSSIEQLSIWRTTISTTGIMNASYNKNLGTQYAYCSSYATYIKQVNEGSAAPSISGGTVTWSGTTTGIAGGDTYKWVAIGEA